MNLPVSASWLAVVALTGSQQLASAGSMAGPVGNPANGHVYYLLTENSWTAAEQEAVSLGGHLVTINDQAEQDWVWAAFGNYAGVRRSLWIGLNDVANEGQFVWSSGEPAAYVNWLWGQPDNNTPIGEDYVHMMGNDRHAELPTDFYGRWNDYQNSDAAYPAYNFGPPHGVVEVVGPPAQGKHFLWQVDYGLSRAFILGSIHVLRSTDHPLPGIFTEAYNQSSKVYFEADLDLAETTPVVNYTVSRATYPSGENLQDKLPPTTYTKLRNFATSQNRPADFFRPYRPWFASAVVTTLAYEDVGAVGANGVDRHFYDLAKSQGRPRAYLETGYQQIDFLANSPESEWLNGLIIQMENPGGGTIPLIENWKQGNTLALAATNTAAAVQSPRSYNALITTRNQNWIGSVTNELVGSKTTMFIVGAAHAVGTDGVPARLAGLGYSVRQLPLIPARLLTLRAFREIPGVQTNEVGIPVVESSNSVFVLPTFTHSKVRLVATFESKPNVTNAWYRDGLMIPGASTATLDTGFPVAGADHDFSLIVSDPEGQRVYNRVRVRPILPHLPELDVATFSPTTGFQCSVSVLGGKRYQVDVTEGFEAGGGWRRFGSLTPFDSGELPLPVLPWSLGVPKRFYRVMEVY